MVQRQFLSNGPICLLVAAGKVSLLVTFGYKRIFPYQETDPSAIIFHLFTNPQLLSNDFLGHASYNVDQSLLPLVFGGMVGENCPLLHSQSSFHHITNHGLVLWKQPRNTFNIIPWRGCQFSNHFLTNSRFHI